MLANHQGVFRIDIPVRRVILGPRMADSDKNQIIGAMVRNGGPRLAEVVRTSSPEKYILYDRLAGNEEIVLT